MQVSRYSTSRCRQNAISATDDTSTLRFSRKSPACSSGVSTLRKLSRVSGVTVEAHAVLGGNLLTPLVTGHDDDAFAGNVDVAQDQGQDALADAAKAQHDQTAAESDVFHRSALLATKQTRQLPGQAATRSDPAW